MVASTREQLDQIINDHFMHEATDNLNGVMDSLGAEIEHEIVPSPVGSQRDAAGIRAYYARLFECVDGESVTPLKRYYGDDFVIDETLWNGYIKDGAPFLCDGKSGPVSFRLLHIFEVQDGKITREQAWVDLAALQEQLGVR